MKLQISLVVSTYGRYEEVELLLESLILQDCNRAVFEVIIVDQNDKIDLSPLIIAYEGKLQLVYYKTTEKGLSKAKNKGIELAQGTIITFPDDDCKFYPDTISSALRFFEKNPDVDVMYGSVYDRNRNKGIMRNWSKSELKLNLFNFSLNYSAISCFTKIRLKFNEDFGVGSKISCGEELDYAIRAIQQKNNVVYSPDTQVWHPELNVMTMDKKKAFGYAYGYGAIMRKNLNLTLLIIFISSMGYQIIRFVLYFFTENRTKFLNAINGRFRGFFGLSQ
ncbi:glycosyltransferase family 2 protein [Sphingobacterium sp. N143]|uniref:glycosyltransferase family 2 protein n=1 Tax=Sphingobacterium sp. N143 TaxID=2746727 RepID=UPI002577860F|nr:glycosyltransferase family 2 protein [Sphingobacterium sp. N143]MDM1295947.1 glycosyltransferase family 2 protein [Sphingobacterium sp. N143]